MRPPNRREAATRRDFLRAAARHSLLVLLAGLGFNLARRSPGQAKGGRCRNNSLCGDCALLAHCDLPEATAARAVQARL